MPEALRLLLLHAIAAAAAVVSVTKRHPWIPSFLDKKKSDRSIASKVQPKMLAFFYLIKVSKSTQKHLLVK